MLELADESTAVAETDTGILDLDGTMCRWPLWSHVERAVDGGRYCGARVAEGAYCRAHALLAYAPPETRRAARVAIAILPRAVRAPETTAPVLKVASESSGVEPQSGGGDPSSQAHGVAVARPAALTRHPLAALIPSDETIPFHDRASQAAHYNAVRQRLARPRSSRREPTQVAAPEPPAVTREEAALPAQDLEEEEIAAALAGIAIGPGNALAVEMLRRLLRDELPGRSLYLYGPSGCGKSLMLSAARAVLPSQRLRILDDAHDAAESRCRHVTGRIVRGLSAGRLPPSDCRAGETLAEAVIVEIQPPDASLCRAALEIEARRLVCVLDERTLDGLVALDLGLPAMLATLRTLVMSGVPVTMEAIAAHAAQIAPQPVSARNVRLDDVLRAVCRHYDVSRDDLLSRRRTANVMMPRQVAMYLARFLTLRSLPEIGRRMGGRDHTTVMHAVNKLARQVETDAAVAADIGRLRTAITGEPTP
ncbi:helix-turn-helix domain-containing protein [Ancylobacter sp.]|uniref:helix-turn-helix domain-containing protein n=1 Tax=Ancylobacter sp. TaxID=1872567 RepID=UPI003D0CFCC1